MSKQRKHWMTGIVHVASGQPMEIIEQQRGVPGILTRQQKNILNQVGSTIKAYLDASYSLLNEQYPHLRDLTPRHLSETSNVMVTCCQDGVIVRYDHTDQSREIVVGWSPETLAQLTPKISESVVYCYPNREFMSLIPEHAPQIVLSKVDGKTNERTDIISIRIGIDAVLERPAVSLAPPPAKPFCLVSAQNKMSFELVGEMIQTSQPNAEPKRFVALSSLRLPVGWECIEVFPFLDRSYWKPQYARVWAEKDILAAAVAAQYREIQLNSLDPYAGARQEFTRILNEYQSLLDSDPEREEVLQSFLKSHSALLCPTKRKVWPKLPLGSRETDFVFQDANGEYLMIEIEKSTDRLFLRNGHTSKELNHARGQVLDWKRYLEDNLSYVHHELGLTGISSNPRSLVVIGRSKSLTPQNRRTLITLENESPKTKIMTYDDVLESAKAVVENLLGPLSFSHPGTLIYYPK